MYRRNNIKFLQKKYVILILSDWNYNAGEDDYPLWLNVIGFFGRGITNYREEKLFEFTEKYKPGISNTLYNHTNS